MKNIPAFGPLHRGHFQLFSTEKAPFYAELMEYLETSVGREVLAIINE